jgi:DNA ligase-1
LWTRHGNVINAPSWFTQELPSVPLDGELWAGRNRFEAASSAVLDEIPDDESWRRIRFMIFDLPRDTRTFDQRLVSLNAMRSALAPVAQIVPQHRISSRDRLLDELHRVVAQGGEGLMLHRADSLYRGERTDDLLKMKPARDAEAKVIDYSPGKGKYTGMTGALIVETADGIRFAIGSGLTDADRVDPPKIGTWVTYRYQTLTANGVPRFARYVRMRPGDEMK